MNGAGTACAAVLLLAPLALRGSLKAPFAARTQTRGSATSASASSPIAADVAPAASLAAPVMAPIVWWGRAETADITRVTARQQEVDRLLNDYNFRFQNWEVHKLLCTCLRRYGVYEGLSLNIYRQPTEFILAVPPAGDAADPLTLIPIWYDGQGFGDAAADLHNVAIFNRIVQVERPRPQNAQDWTTLAVLYLMLAGQEPQLIDATTREAVVRPRMPKQNWPAPPSVTPLPDDQIGVEFVNFTENAELVRWEFHFDADGMLRWLSSTLLTKGSNPNIQ